MEIKLKTLTPLWTGGVDRDSAELKETSILGTLRWWYEGIIRGLGTYACDPTGEDRCQYDEKKGPNALCPACRLFGCTGWARRFRVMGSDLGTMPLFFMANEAVYSSAGNWLFRIFGGKDLDGRMIREKDEVRFIFGVKALWSDSFDLTFVPTHGDARATLDVLVYLLDVVTTWGALGAKAQNGFGQVKVLSGLDSQIIADGRNLVQAEAKKGKPLPKDDRRFNLASFFGRVYELSDPAPYEGIGHSIGEVPPGFDYRFIPCAFDIRYKSSSSFRGRGRDFGMRPFFRERYGRRTTNELLGESRARTDEERSGSRIYVSHLFREERRGRYHLKIWGYVPPGLCQPVGVDEVASAVDEFISGAKGMFRASTVLRRYNMKEVLGL